MLEVDEFLNVLLENQFLKVFQKFTVISRKAKREDQLEIKESVGLLLSCWLDSFYMKLIRTLL